MTSQGQGTQWIWDAVEESYFIWSPQHQCYEYQNGQQVKDSRLRQLDISQSAPVPQGSGSRQPTRPSTIGQSARGTLSPAAVPYQPPSGSAPINILQSKGKQAQYLTNEPQYDSNATPRAGSSYTQGLEQNLASLSLSRTRSTLPTAYSPSYLEAENVQFNVDKSSGFVDCVVTDPSGVQSRWQGGPTERLTDDTVLLEAGIRVNKKFKGTQSNVPDAREALHSGFIVRRNPKSFYQVGRVFHMLYAEPAGRLTDPFSELTFDSRFGEAFHVKVRRFVVIRENDLSCSAISIWTYNGQGVAKRGVKKSDHAIIHTGRTAPRPQPDELPRRDEQEMIAEPIRVDANDRTENLDEMSRLNFAKVYTVEHNVKVYDFGFVNRNSIDALITQFRLVWFNGIREQRSQTQQGSRSQSRPRADSARQSAGASGSPPLRSHMPAVEEIVQTPEEGSDNGAGDDDLSANDIFSRLIDYYQERQGWTREQAVAAIRSRAQQIIQQNNCSRNEAARVLWTTMSRQRS